MYVPPVARVDFEREKKTETHDNGLNLIIFEYLYENHMDLTLTSFISMIVLHFNTNYIFVDLMCDGQTHTV